MEKWKITTPFRMLFTKEHAHTKNSILEKQNVSRKSMKWTLLSSEKL